MLEDMAAAGNTGLGDCIRIVCFTAVVGEGGNGVSTYSEKPSAKRNDYSRNASLPSLTQDEP